MAQAVDGRMGWHVPAAGTSLADSLGNAGIQPIWIVHRGGEPAGLYRRRRAGKKQKAVNAVVSGDQTRDRG